MRILVLNGSPKREKSDTLHITRAFLEGMKEATPQEIHVIDVIDRRVRRLLWLNCETRIATINDDDALRRLEGRWKNAFQKG